MKKITALLLSVLMLLSLAACNKNDPEETTASTTAPTTTPAATEPVEELEHYDLNETDLASIGELFAQKETDALCKIQLDGLCTPVVLELDGTNIISISAYDITVLPDPDSDYTSIYGNLWPVIYDQEGLIFLNIWEDDTGYSCVIFPDGTYKETYPDEDYSVMIYLDEENRMCQSRFAMKFLSIEQWDTGPIDMAVSRDDFYYSVDDASWTKEDGYTVTDREYYTISDCFALDEIFDTAKENGLYPEFETLDELLAYNEQRFRETEGDDPNLKPDSVREEVRYFDELMAVYEYDSNHNLLKESFYTNQLDCIYFVKTHSYDGKNRETAGSWSYEGEEAYRYTNAYDEQDRITETVWYQGDKEVERFTYTYQKNGHTETFYKNGQKQHCYTFDQKGQLTAHSVFKDGQEIKTQDPKSLVKTQLLTDVWCPFIDNGTEYRQHCYIGTVPTLAPNDALKTPNADGSYVLISEGVDTEFDETYRHEYHYSADDKLLRAIHIWEGVESLRDEYQYDSNGLCIRQVTYIDSEQDMVTQWQYDSTGMPVCIEREYTNPVHFYRSTVESGEVVTKEYTYTHYKETYRYNDRGLLTETVIYGDDQQIDLITYRHDENGNALSTWGNHEYVYNAEGVLEGIWVIYEDHAAGMALLRSRTVYVTAENAHQLRDIMRNELTWF